MRETKNIEFKEKVTHTFLKTVSAYCNYGEGKILFGVKDDGTLAGIDNLVDSCLDIENLINANIDPKPDYSLDIDDKDKIITLTVSEGIHKPYLYKGKAYKRNDSSTVEVDRLELTRLILQGQNLSYEQLQADNQELTFNILESKLKETLHLETVNLDTLKTLELYTPDVHFNHAAELVADENQYHGIDIVRFGEDINIILNRFTIKYCSVLSQFDKAIEVYRWYYQYEVIDGATRNTVELIPERAFREAVANALVHKTWDIPASINISMYNDRIVIVSPGGLPTGINAEEYMTGGISILRNPIIANIFFRLNLIEKFGTDIRRIISSYSNYEVNPVFNVTDNTISITLPVIKMIENLSEDEKKVLSSLKNSTKAMSELIKVTGFSQTKLLKILSKLIESGMVRKTGTGRGTKYVA